MGVNLRTVEAELIDYERPMFDIFKATLRYPVTTEEKATKLADDIAFFFRSREKNVDLGEMTWRVWSLLLDIASAIPAGHPWQDSLLQALENLQQRGDTLLDENDVGAAIVLYPSPSRLS